MDAHTVTLLYFSPTGTTRTLARRIGSALGIQTGREIDLTSPTTRERPVTIDSDLLLVGMPVYEERVPAFALEALRSAQINGKRVIAFSVYGNVGFGLSLKELHSALTEKGLAVVALAAFVGEHSFSTEAIPLARGRPDGSDLDRADAFAELCRARLSSGETVEAKDVPGKLPPMARIMPPNSARALAAAPEKNARCDSCLACARLCPMGAIGPDLSIDETLCVRCFACARACGKAARGIRFRVPVLPRAFLILNGLRRREPLFV